MRPATYRFASLQEGQYCWRMARNCSIAPRHFALIFVFLCTVSLGVGLMFYLQGAGLVLPFAMLEVVALGIAFFVYARHATDMERIELSDRHLVVEIEDGGKLRRTEFQRGGIQVALLSGRKALIEVSSQGRSVAIGRHVRPELRTELAREITRALRV
jgi:uncharacterized membrane protein